MTVKKTKEFDEYLKSISQRAEDVRSGIVHRTDDNMLKITTDGRRAALDLRLVDSNSEFSPLSKVAVCAEKVADIYFKTMTEKSAQLIFCDVSTPKSSFNMYDELKDRISAFGIPRDQIAFIHDAGSEAERTELFRKVREGEIRILLGSTFKLGLGVNIQDRLIALHHLDVPWRPADMTQREGRILRQGNRNQKVAIFRYITEGSFDAYSWQMLETKQRFIADLLSGSLTEREGSDIEDTVLDYAKVKALAVGNPLVKERVEVQNELSRYMSLQKKQVETRIRLEKELLELPGKMEGLKSEIEKATKDHAWYLKWKANHPEAESEKEKKADVDKRKELRESLNQSVKEYTFMEKEKLLDSYKGFDIILPANMSGEKPYVWLSHEGKYSVEMGDTQMGNLMRIDYSLESLGKRAKKLKTNLVKYEDRAMAIQKELSNTKNYSEQIETLRQKVNLLDEELGVNKDE